jgi:Fic family protein
MSYQPPFTITPQIINQISIISQQIGQFDRSPLTSSPQLRKQNRIRTIQGTLAIEGNSLTSPSQPRSTGKNSPRDQVRDQVSDQVSDQVQQLLAVMDDQYYSARTLMQAGLVVMKYPHTPHHPQQRYGKP